MEIAIILSILAIAGASATAFKLTQKKKKDELAQKQQEVKQAHIPTPKEQQIIDLINKMMNETNPPQSLVIRDKTTPSPALNNKSWIGFHQTNPSGMYHNNTIYINRDTEYPDDQHFGMTYIHELMHHQGHHHSKAMTTEESRLHRIFYGLAKEQSLI
jgi:hypothetical protein